MSSSSKLDSIPRSLYKLNFLLIMKINWNNDFIHFFILLILNSVNLQIKRYLIKLLYKEFSTFEFCKNTKK